MNILPKHQAIHCIAFWSLKHLFFNKHIFAWDFLANLSFVLLNTEFMCVYNYEGEIKNLNLILM